MGQHVPVSGEEYCFREYNMFPTIWNRIHYQGGSWSSREECEYLRTGRSDGGMVTSRKRGRQWVPFPHFDSHVYLDHIKRAARVVVNAGEEGTVNRTIVSVPVTNYLRRPRNHKEFGSRQAQSSSIHHVMIDLGGEGVTVVWGEFAVSRSWV